MDDLHTWYEVPLCQSDIVRLAKNLSRMSWTEMDRASGWSASHLKSIAADPSTGCNAQLLLDVLSATGCSLAIGKIENQ